MKNQNILFILIVIFTIGSNAQTIIPPGNVSGTWILSGSPYKIQGDITIPYSLTLMVEPGVLVEFQGHYKLDVQGRLLAIGTQSDTIIFTVHDTTGFHNITIPDGGWSGIRFSYPSATNDSSKIIYCKLEYGKAIGSWPDDNGGAISINTFDKIVINNCLITKNSTSGTGGGIALWNSKPKIIGNTISQNRAQFGGGIQCYESSPDIFDNMIRGNSAEGGGGIVCNENSRPIIKNTIIEENTANMGGGIVSWQNCSIVLDNVTFNKNAVVAWDGGGISTYNCNLEIKNCLFTENSAKVNAGAVSFGADTSVMGIPYGISIDSSRFQYNTSDESSALQIFNFAYTPLNVDAEINDCEFINNSSDRFAALGIWDTRFSISRCVFKGNTAESLTGAAGFRAGSKGIVSNCLFASNTANTSHSGGATVLSWSSVDFINCTFTNNSSLYGAGLTVTGNGVATATNCIFWGNNTNQIALDTLNGQGGTLSVNYCDVQGGKDSIKIIGLLPIINWGDGNIDADPIFANTTISDYHLQNTSPCVASATDSIKINEIMIYCPLLDIEGNVRPNPPGSKPDNGAYESSYLVGIVKDESLIPATFSLSQNYPNPFNPVTVISYQLPVDSWVTLRIYNLLGVEIATLVNENKKIGRYEIKFDASSLSSGIYYYRLVAEQFNETKKLILIR